MLLFGLVAVFVLWIAVACLSSIIKSSAKIAESLAKGVEAGAKSQKAQSWLAKVNEISHRKL